MIQLGDVVSTLQKYDDDTFSGCFCDPPYGLNFMGNKWDGQVPDVTVWKEVYRVLKSGSMLLAFGGTRTFHRLAVAIEDAGFEIRDTVMWVYGSGFPKSHNIGKKLPEWEGWGTGLKPCYEPILLAQKPISEKTVVENVKTHGVGGLNIDATRVDGENGRWPGNVLHDGSEEVEKEFEKYGESLDDLLG